MLVIFKDCAINMDDTSFFIHKSNPGFNISFYSAGKSVSEIYFKDYESAKKVFDRIIHFFSNEFRTLDLNEYGE